MKQTLKNFLNKLQKFSSSTVMLLVAIITFSIGILAIGITIYFKVVINFAGEDCHFKFDNIFLNILYTVLSIGVLYLVYKILPKINEKILLVLALIFTLIIGLVWVNYIKLKPLADQSMVVYCAECLLDNNLKNILDPGQYLNRNPHQLVFVVFIMAFFKLFNSRNPLNLQILNCIFSTLNILLLYLICREIFKEDLVRKITILLLAFFSFYWMFFNTHIYGNIPGLTFALLAVLFTLKFIEKQKVYKAIIIALSIAISYLLKNNYEIFLLAIIITLVLNLLQTKKILPVITIAIIILTTFGLKTLIYNITENTTGYSLDTGVDMRAYIYMGIAEPATLSPGWYTSDVEEIYKEAGYDKEKSKDIARDDFFVRVNDLINNLSYTRKFFSEKIQTTWLNPTFQAPWCSTPSILLDVDVEYNNRISQMKLIISILTGTAFKIEERIFDIYQIITFTFAGIGLFLLVKEGDIKKSLFPIVFLGGFLFHIIWETKSIYVIQYFYIMLPFSAYGLYKLFSKFDKIFSKKEAPKQIEGAKILQFKKH